MLVAPSATAGTQLRASGGAAVVLAAAELSFAARGPATMARHRGRRLRIAGPVAA